MRKLILLLLIPIAVWAGTSHVTSDTEFSKDVTIGDSSADTLTINATTVQGASVSFSDGDELIFGTSGTHYEMDTGENPLKMYVNNSTNSGNYDEAANIYLYGDGGDGTGAIRALNARSYLRDGGYYAEIYGADIEAIQEDGAYTAGPLNLYNVMQADVAETETADCPSEMVTGVFGIISNSGGATYAVNQVKAAIVGAVWDNAGNDADGIVSMLNGDSGASPNNPGTAYYGIRNRRSTGTDIHAYGIDFNDASSLTGEVRVAEIRLQNEETIDNLADGIVNVTGALTITDDLTYGQSPPDKQLGYKDRSDYITFIDTFTVGVDATYAADWNVAGVVGAGTNTVTVRDGWSELVTGGAGGPDMESTVSIGLANYRAYAPRLECVAELAGTAGQRFEFGFYAAGTEYVEVVHDTAIGANWYLIVDDTAGADTIDSGVAVTADPTKLEIQVDAAGTVHWAINDVAMTEVGLTNLMTASAHYHRWMLTDIAAAPHTVAVDYVQLEQLKMQ